MSDIRAGIYQVVASPKQFLWAPFEMAIINIVMGIMIMLLCITVFNLTPFFAIIPLIGGHVTLLVLGTRNPHLFTTLKAMGKYPPSRKRNLSPVKVGVKYVP
jgi:hypothetical protein